MLYVRMELWPRGHRSEAKVLGEATISNIGGTKKRGNYQVLLSRRHRSFEDPVRPKPKEVWRTFEMKDFPRLSLTAWDLLCRALKGALVRPTPKQECVSS
jgi:hypothetical protein